MNLVIKSNLGKCEVLATTYEGKLAKKLEGPKGTEVKARVKLPFRGRRSCD